MVNTSIRSTGMRRSWWGTPLNRTARWRRAVAAGEVQVQRPRLWRDQQYFERCVEIMRGACTLFIAVFFVSAAVGAKAQTASPAIPANGTATLSQVRMSQAMGTSHRRGGNLYMQTNEVRNTIVHYRWSASGTLTEVERVPTGGAGSGELSPIYHVNRPNDFEGAGSVILTADRRFLFATNAGDNSVSSFAVSEDDGELALVDTKRTGNATSGGAKSLAYAPSSRTLYVLHTFGPDHLRLMSVDAKGKLTARPERYSVNTMDW